jgi:plastocyanin
MRSYRGEGIAAAAAALIAAIPLFAGVAQGGIPSREIAADDPPGAPAFAFTPDDVEATIAYEIHWSRGVDGDAKHGIRQTAGLFGLAPTLGEIDFTRKPSAGTFRYFCPIHGSPGRGMDGVLRVAPLFDSDPSNEPGFTIRWANEESRDTGGRFDVRFRRQGGSEWTMWKNDTKRDQGEFGVGDEPVTVRPGRMYEFQARSEKLNDPSKRSGWSPVLVAGE